MEGMSLLTPTSIAVIGASATEGKVGHDVLKNLLTQGYAGKVFPVNPKGGEILGKKVYASLGEIDGSIDCAIIVTPAPTVPGVLRECGEKGIKNIVIISAGFKETGTDEGRKLEEDVRSIAKQYSMDVLGPNCLGMLCPSIGLNASFAKAFPPAGKIALISQSGAFLVAMLDAASTAGENTGFGFSTVLSIGNKTVLDECDFLERCAEDPGTNVIGLYLESIEDGMRFRHIAERVIASGKSIVLLKAGTSTTGRRAAASHTGALAGSESAIVALCRQTGIHRAQNFEEFTDLLQVLCTQPALLTPRIAIVTNAGGPGILATDAAEATGLLLPGLTPSIEKALKETLPSSASTKNPIDVIGDGGADRFTAALAACASDPSIDGVVVLLTPQVMTPVREVALAIIEAASKTPLMPVVASFMGGASVIESRAILTAHGIPNFETPERAVRAMGALARSSLAGSSNSKASEQRATSQRATREKSGATLLKNKHGLLPEDATIELLRLYHLPTPRQSLARSLDEAVTIANKIGYPVVAKISAPEILHKTDVGGIRGDIETEEELTVAFRGILQSVQKKAPEARIRGILIQKFLPVGSELIIGGLRDASFGPLVMAGLGGIYTELFRDTSFRLAPLTEEDAYAQLRELKAWKMLAGMRGKEPADIAAIARILLGVSSMLLDCPQIRELDFNPVLIHGNEVTVADAKIVLA